jgi:hypothetical protein
VIRFSASLVSAACVLLIVGVVTSDLKLVYIAIGISSLALVALVAGASMKREELFGHEFPSGATLSSDAKPARPVPAHSVPAQSASAQSMGAPGGSVSSAAETGWGFGSVRTADQEDSFSSSAPSASPLTGWPETSAPAPATVSGFGSDPGWESTSGLAAGGGHWSGLAEASRFEIPLPASYTSPLTETPLTEAPSSGTPDTEVPSVEFPDSASSSAQAEETPDVAATAEAGTTAIDQPAQDAAPDMTTAFLAEPDTAPGLDGDAALNLGSDPMPGPDSDTTLAADADAEPAMDDSAETGQDVMADPAADALPGEDAFPAADASTADASADEADTALPSASTEAAVAGTEDTATATAATATADTTTAEEPPDSPASEPDPSREVTVVPGVPRYHNARCILIRFMGDGDLEKTTLAKARDAGCTPCRACLPDQDLPEP